MTVSVQLVMCAAFPSQRGGRGNEKYEYEHEYDEVNEDRDETRDDDLEDSYTRT